MMRLIPIRAFAIACLLLAAGSLAPRATAGEDRIAFSRNVLDYGATGRGVNTETAAIQGAIDACAVEGGCTLHFPPGRYVTGTLFLRDSVTLHLAPGAVIATSSKEEDYPAPALFYGKGIDGVTLTGEGEVQAGPVPVPDETTIRNPGSRLLSLVLIENSTNIRIRDIRFRRSPAWTITLRVVDSAWIENVAIDNAMMVPNTSGIVLDSASRVTIRGVHYRGGGEGIALQTSLVNGVAPPCELIGISDSSIRSASMAIKIGTQTHGPIRQIVVDNVVVEGSQGGIGIIARDGGVIESVAFSNLSIQTRPVRRDVAEWPIVIDAKRRTEDAKPSDIRIVSFTNVQVQTGGKVLFSGMTSHPIRQLRVDGLTLAVTLPAQTPKLPQRPWKSDVDNVTGEDQTAAAMLLGYVADAALNNVRVSWQGAEPFPEAHAAFIHTVDNIQLNGWQARQAKVGGDLAALQVIGSRAVEIRNSTALPQTGVFLQLQRMNRQDLFLSGNNAQAAYRELVVIR